MKRVLFLSVIMFIFLFVGCGMDLDWRQDEAQNNLIQPPGKIMDIIGVKEGMVIGEFGAARGRFTVPLANRVGENGCVYANDVDKSSLKFLRKRCQKAGIMNVKTILGKYDDPLFPKGSLDMAFSSLVYHEIGNPVIFLKNLIPALKHAAPIVIVDFDPSINKEKSNIGRDWEKEFEDAGLEIVKKEKLPERDVIFILKSKNR